jgi:hypothetical protein
MASRCVNPQCAVPWNLFGAGALYAVEMTNPAHSPRCKEYIWLCASCAAHLTLRTDAGWSCSGDTTVKNSIPPATRRHAGLRLVFRSTWVRLPMKSMIRKQTISTNRSW